MGDYTNAFGFAFRRERVWITKHPKEFCYTFLFFLGKNLYMLRFFPNKSGKNKYFHSRKITSSFALEFLEISKHYRIIFLTPSYD